jgi:hypothetical protein
MPLLSLIGYNIAGGCLFQAPVPPGRNPQIRNNYFIKFLIVYNGELERNLINYAIKLLKMIMFIISD